MGRPPRPYVKDLADARAAGEALEREKQWLKQAGHRATKDGAMERMLRGDPDRWKSKRTLVRRLKVYQELQQTEKRLRNLHQELHRQVDKARRRVIGLQAAATAKQIVPPAELDALLQLLRPSEVDRHFLDYARLADTGTGQEEWGRLISAVLQQQ